jgi:hypothetical protein
MSKKKEPEKKKKKKPYQKLQNPRAQCPLEGALLQTKLSENMNLKPRLDFKKVLPESLKQQIHQLQLTLRFIVELKELNIVSKIYTLHFSVL